MTSSNRASMPHSGEYEFKVVRAARLTGGNTLLQTYNLMIAFVRRRHVRNPDDRLMVVASDPIHGVHGASTTFLREKQLTGQKVADAIDAALQSDAVFDLSTGSFKIAYSLIF